MRYLVSFRSRVNSVRFYDEMKRIGEAASLTSNRKQCGLSVRVNCLDAAMRILGSCHFSSFCSIYEVVDGVEHKVY